MKYCDDFFGIWVYSLSNDKKMKEILLGIQSTDPQRDEKLISQFIDRIHGVCNVPAFTLGNKFYSVVTMDGVPVNTTNSDKGIILYRILENGYIRLAFTDTIEKVREEKIDKLGI